MGSKGFVAALAVAAVAAVAGQTTAAGDRTPGSYLTPLVPLQRLDGDNTHLHVDEVRLRPDGLLLQCSYTFGVVDARDAARMRYLAQGLTHTIPGDTRRPGCVHLAWDGDVVYTTHRGNIRNPPFLSGWDISDRRNPVQLPVLQEPGVSYEGVDAANGRVFAALHAQGLGIYERRAGAILTRVGTLDELSDAWGVRVRGDLVFVADGAGGLVIVDASDAATPRVLGRAATGGLARDVALDGSLAYVAAGSAGLVVVDVSDPATPAVVGAAPMPGTALRVDYSAGHVFVAAWNDARVYDVSNPSSPRFVGAVRLTRDINVPEDDRPAATSRTLGIAARDRDVFLGNWHQIYSYRLYPDRAAPNLRLPEAAGLLDFGQVAAGSSQTITLPVTNQGTAPLTIFSATAVGPGFTVSPRRGEIAPGETFRLSLTYEASGTARQDGYLQIFSDDPAAPRRTAFLVGNQPGLGVNMLLPETIGVLLDGSTWSSSEAAGRPLLLNFFATFCPVCGGQLPDVETRFWQKYRDRGLVVVSLNAHDGMDRIGEVDQYVNHLGITFRTGLEQSTTYRRLTQNFAGTNPFPVDVLVDREGRIAYIAREYDPDAMTEILERLLDDGASP